MDNSHLSRKFLSGKLEIMVVNRQSSLATVVGNLFRLLLVEEATAYRVRKDIAVNSSHQQFQSQMDAIMADNLHDLLVLLDTVVNPSNYKDPQDMPASSNNSQLLASKGLSN